MKKSVTKFFIKLSVLLLAVIMQVISVFTYPSSLDFLSGSGINIPLGHKKNMQSVSSNHFTISKATFPNDGCESEGEGEISSKPVKKLTEYSKYFSHYFNFDIHVSYTANVQKCLLTQKHFYHAATCKRYILFEVFRI